MKKIRLKSTTNGKKIMVYTFLVSFILLFIISTVKWFPFTSLGADTTTVVLEATLEKYINYYLSEQDKGTLVQYKIRNKIEYGEEFLPLTKSEIITELGKIDGQYPSEVKVITESTAATNGRINNFENFSQYDAATGMLLIQANNQNEKGELIRQEKPDSNTYDSYILICYYNTYTEENEERELNAKVTAKATLSNEENTQISREEQYSNPVTENIGELTSINCETPDIYNGYIKSNVINGTNYATQYQQIEQIMVSKKEAQENIEVSENNIFVKTQENIELGNNKNLVYQSTEVQEKDIKGLLGEDGVLEILDTDENVIATIDKNTEFNENGVFILHYENEVEAIKIRTSNVTNEGILNLKHIKEIKSTMTDVEGVSIKTTLQMEGKEDTYEVISELKDAETKVDVKLSNVNWSNSQQNEVTFDMDLEVSKAKNNMFKNPTLQIELPSQVEKVILGNSSIVYANGLVLQEPYLITNEKGNLVIVAELKGEQTEYKENSLESITNVKIAATIILNKEIESTNEIVKVAYSNQYTLDGSTDIGNREIQVQLENYKEENVIPEEEKIIYNTAQTLRANNDDLKMEVAPTKGNTTIKNGDIVYEGEYIKYNIKITNTSSQNIDNVKVVATIPEGTIYGELETDYYNYRKSYKYNFDEELTEKTIEIGTVKAGESKTAFYEVKVKDLVDGEEEKSIITKMNSYIGEELVQNYEVSNIVKSSEAQLFMNSLIDYGGWTYGVNLMSEKEEEVNVKVHLPQAFQLEQIIYVSHNVEDPIKYVATPEDHGVSVYTNYDPLPAGQEQIRTLAIEVSDDNVITTKLKANCYYEFIGKIDTTQFDKQADIATMVLPSYTEAIINNNTYTSNENRVEVAYENVEVSMTSSNEGEKVKYEEEVDYEITIKNIGGFNVIPDNWVDYTVVKVSDFLPEELEAVSVTYNNWELEEAETGEKKLVELEDITKDISGIEKDENGKKLANVDISILIPKGESATVKVKATAGYVYEETHIENMATISSDKISEKTTNIIAHTILPYNYDEQNEPDEPDEPDVPIDPDEPDEPDDPNVPDDPNDPNNPDDPDIPVNPSEKYNISGTAWIDENEDGKRSSEEKLLTGMTVMLVDTKNFGTVKITTQTNDSGMYQFSDLEEGNYLVVFRYDTDNYQLTEYQKSGVSSSLNSDAISKAITLDGEQVLVGITDTIELNKSATNIDIGLIENKLCDFKIEKYISKVTVRTTSGIREYNYGNSSLAKAEIKAKEISGATVVIEYKMVVTNVGEVAGTVNKIVDYLPDGLSFSSDLNKNWAKSTNGELVNTSNTNKKIKAGESIELTLIATKQMTTDSTGTFKNRVEIKDVTGTTGTSDANSENNTAEADVIISVSTGAIVYITIIISTLGILSLIVIWLYKKGKIDIKKFGKTTFLSIFFVIMLFVQSSDTIAASVYDSWEFTYVQSENGPTHTFTGGPTGIGYCMNHSLEAYNGTFSYWYAYDSYTANERTVSTGDFTLTKVSSNVPMNVSGSNFIYGPFTYNCSSSASYSYAVYDKSGNTISGASLCDANGRGKTLSGSGNITFYLKIPQSNCSNGVAKVEVEAKATVTKTISKDLYVQGAYYLSSEAQPVSASDYVYAGTTSSISSTEKEKKITWTDINGSLEIIKVDKDDNDEKLPEVQFRITCTANNYDKTFTTDPNGEIHIYNLQRGTYTIKEVSNPHYGYEATASGSAKVTKGKEVSKVIPNEKQTGNLKIKKKDKDNKSKPIPGVSFKIKNSEGKYVIAVDQSGQQQTKVTGIINLGDMKFTSNKNAATEFVTNTDGVIEIYNMLIDTYTVEEISVGDNYGYILEDKNITWEAKAQNDDTGAVSTVTVERQSSKNTKSSLTSVADAYANILTVNNEKQTGNLRINKKDPDNNQGLKGMTFNIKNSKGEYVIAVDESGNAKTEVTGEIYLGNMQFTTDENQATKFITNDSGIIEIRNILIDTYTIKETSVGDNYYGYEVDGEYISWEIDKKDQGTGVSKAVEVERQTSQNTEPDSKVTDSTATVTTVKNKRKYVMLTGYVWEDYYQGKTSERNDLYDENGQDKLLEHVTVRLKNENGGVVEFKKTRDGDTVPEVETNTNGSYEMWDVLIDDLDKLYIEFTYNGMSYECIKVGDLKQANTSKASEGSERTTFNEEYHTITKDQSNNASGSKTHDLVYDVEEHTSTLRLGDKNGLKYGYTGQAFPINGVYEQYEITSTTLNGCNGYIDKIKSIEEIRKSTEEIARIENINLGVYEREQPDIALVKDLQNVKLTINGYEHTYVYAQRFLNAGEYGDGFNVGVKFGSKYGSMSYTRAIYKADYEYINEQNKDKELKVYVTYKITMRNQSDNLTAQINNIVDYYDNKYQIVKVGSSLNEKEEIVGDIAHTETTYDGNYTKMMIENKMKIENQKEESIYVQFLLNREAVINILNDKENLNNVAEINSYSISDGGKVYAGIDRDSNPGNCTPGDTKTYEDDTDSSPALKLEVADAREMAGKVFLDSTSGELQTGNIRQGSGIYEDGEKGIEGVDITFTENTGSGKVYTAKTDANGDFLITGYIPGDYTLTYTWGDQTYTVQDYKGTVYNTARNQNDKNWYKQDVDTRYTDAIDNYATDQEAPKGSRKQIDSEIATVNTANITRTKMDSTTPTMGIGVEYETTYTASMGDRYTYKIMNVDFGIVERARQVLDISKDVTGVKITLTNGQTIVDAKIVDGKLQGDNIKGVTYMGPSNGNNGLVKAEIDNELIQGATIQIEYTIKVENKGEVDYDSENYYKYGTKEGNIIQIKPDVYDYLDSQMVLNSNRDNGKWEVVSRSDYDATYTSPTTIETYFSEGKTTETRPDGTEVSVYRWEVSENSYQTLFTEWATKITEQRTIRGAKLDSKTILNNVDLETELAPGESKSINLYTSKVLSNTDEIDLNNDTEITEMRRVQQTGRIPDIITSHTYDKGETVTVTPPTGEDQDYILPIMIGVTALMILGAGVVLIKKKVM